MSDFLAIVTTQLKSERLENKGIAMVAGKPLLQWLIQRISDPQTGIGAQVIVATPADPANDPVEALCKKLGIPCHRQESNRDVVGEMDAVVQKYNPKFITRILADCPFISRTIVRRVIHCLRKYPDKELFLYFLPSWSHSVYGSREFPMTRKAWSTLAANAKGDEREHPDLWLNRNRHRFNILYHEGLSNWYYAHQDRIRLEVDWPEDLEMVRAVAEKGPGMLAPLVGKGGILPWLQQNEQYCKNAKLRRERTGPTVSYTNEEQKVWRNLMNKADFVLTWENVELRPPDGRALQVFCQSGQCLLGWGVDGLLHRLLPFGPDGQVEVIGHSPRLVCECGAGGKWWKKIEK